MNISISINGKCCIKVYVEESIKIIKTKINESINGLVSAAALLESNCLCVGFNEKCKWKLKNILVNNCN